MVRPAQHRHRTARGTRRPGWCSGRWPPTRPRLLWSQTRSVGSICQLGPRDRRPRAALRASHVHGSAAPWPWASFPFRAGGTGTASGIARGRPSQSWHPSATASWDPLQLSVCPSLCVTTTFRSALIAGRQKVEATARASFVSWGLKKRFICHVH